MSDRLALATEHRIAGRFEVARQLFIELCADRLDQT
jgi:hypothetical protein